MVNDFPGNNTEPYGNRAVNMQLGQFFRKLSILLWNGSVGTFVEEGLDFNIKISDILIGPF